ncbi:3-deoxy-D-manno-octulosonic acid transferase [Caldichromatium japonicum]|uniref:3-deoxy-D-manno-octulosonic acid transferase n=1 Tax=Caldichromatium japonicum TaxID=2699430 RepID=A0A6G7VBE7_9GAMM|nr:lipid IV(A) 3-deoxy-D-manno-octulosonic acid transferase [Caldichromatium japonicum]QIK37117.1 3-deoxy-D-manno-octulosonic acid transferase [Caldichromatium japonicum]
MIRTLYIWLWYLALPWVLVRLWWRGRLQPAYRQRIGERLGWGPAPRAEIWLHAVSVGEVQAAEPLIRWLLATPRAPSLLLTTTTPTGAERVRLLFGKQVAHRYLPFDLPRTVARFLAQVQPRLVLIMETELWPNLLAELKRRAIPVALVNARLSERSARRYRLLGTLVPEMLNDLALIAAQSSADAARFIDLGAPHERVRVTGNLKFDRPEPPHLMQEAQRVRALWGVERPVWVAASTHEGEEEQVLAAHRRLLTLYPEALLVLVPRHPERFDRVARLIERLGFDYVRRSMARAVSPHEAVYLGDSMGELPVFLAAADLAFIGGSLVPKGGHNPLEAAAVGVPILIGPSIFNFAAIIQSLVEAGACLQVTDGPSLTQGLGALFAASDRRFRMGAAGRELVSRHCGSIERLLTVLQPWLDAPV